MTLPALPSYIPSPSTNGLSIGPLRLHVYGVMIALGVAAAVWLAQRRWERIGGARGTMASVAIWAVPGGLIGSRLYSLATSWGVDTQGHWYRAFEIWQGGLGIWGGIAGGVAAGAFAIRRLGLPLRPLLDCAAPALALAQAIGRWGNYFNQELYGRPSGLPWAVKIDNPQVPGHVYAPGTTFQPTFLYESLWDLAVVGLVIWAERRFRIRRGYLVGVYAACYTFGRFWTEYLRIDEAHRFLGLRLNDWTSIIVFAAAVAVLAWRGRAVPGEAASGDPVEGLPVGDDARPADELRPGPGTADEPARGDVQAPGAPSTSGRGPT